MITETQYINAVNRINAIHNEDISSETTEGKEVKAELLYSERMLSVLKLVAPDSSHELKLAALCQHMSRWSIPRATFPMDKKGYYQWRAAIMDHQLEVTTRALAESGIDEQSIAVVKDALKNKADKSNENASIIEDTACLVFIKWYLEPFASQFDTTKAADILRKTAKKMSERGLGLISQLNLTSSVSEILKLIG